MLDRLSPYVRVAMDSWLADDTCIDRMIWDYEILLLKQGRLQVTVEDTAYSGEPGDIFLFKPRQRHAIRVPNGETAHQPHVHFDLIEAPDSADVRISYKQTEDMNDTEIEWFRKDMLSEGEWQLPNHISLRSHLAFEELLFELIREYEMRMPFYQVRVKSLMLELLVCLFREVRMNQLTEQPERYELLYEVQRYLNIHAHHEVTLDELSARFHLNKHYLVGLFRQAFHITPIQYHQRIRLNRAKNLIRHTRQSIEQIAGSLGYSSIHAFSRAFKNKEGVSPTSYRSLSNGF